MRATSVIASVFLVVVPAMESPALQMAADIGRLRQAIREQIDHGDYGAAEAQARALLRAINEVSAGNQSEIDRASDLLVEASTKNGYGTDVDIRTLAEALVRRREPGLGNDALPLATALRNLGDALFQAGDYTRAAAEFARGLRLREGVTAADDPDVAEDLDHEAQALSQIGQLDQALAASSRALLIRERISRDADGPTARTLTIRSLVWQRKGDYPKARADLERALAIWRAGNTEHPEVAKTLMRFGTQMILEGDLPEAQRVLEQAASVAQKTLRRGHPDIPAVLRELATSVRILGNLSRARALQEEAVSTSEAALGPEHRLTADCLNDLAGTLLVEGDYTASRSLYERALKIYEHIGPDYPDIPTVVYNLALLNTKLGDFRRARVLHQRAIEAWQRRLGPEHAIVARALWEFGDTLAEEGQYRAAQPLFERALAIRRRTLGAGHPAVATTLSSLANTVSRLGQPRRGLELSQEALEIWQKSPTPEPGAYSESLLVHAAILAARGDYEDSLRTYDRAQQIRLPMFGASHPAVAQTDIARAEILAKAGRPEQALQVTLRAEEIGRGHLHLMLGSLPEREALDYAAKRPTGLDLALSLSPPTGSNASVLDAFIRSRALVLDEVAARGRALADERAGALAPLWTTLTAARQQLANLVIRGPSGLRSEQYLSLVEEKQRDKEEAERALAEKSTTFRSELTRADIGLQQVQVSLPPDTVLVSFVRYNRTVFVNPSAQVTAGPSTGSARRVRIVPSYVAFVVAPDRTEPTELPLGAAAVIDAQITAWRKKMIADVTVAPGTATAGPSLRALGIALRQRVWDPVAAHVGAARRVLVVPDGAINLLPLAALPLSNGRYLLEDGPVIHYLSAERDVVTDDRAPSASGTGLLAVGGPAFADGSSFAQARAANASPTTLRAAPSNCVTFRSLRFGALPASGAEVQGVASLWQRFNVDAVVPASLSQALTGTAATEGAFKRLAPGRRVLHIATHGFFLGDDCAPAVEGTRSVGGLTAGANVASTPSVARPASGRGSTPENPLLLSGLALAGANRRAAAAPNEEDGILTAEEVAALNLEGVEWAVLSACDTGLGTVAAGEGVLGLRRAFQVAGVRTVIMSLWSVEDRATRLWMEALYRARLAEHLDTADAVRAASLSLIRERRAKGQSTNPFYWAAFVAAGDWR